MSSHREAPEISKDPVADNTDVYAFVSPDKPRHGDDHRQLPPARRPRRAARTSTSSATTSSTRSTSTTTATASRTSPTSFQFRTEVRNPKTFLYNTGPIGSLDDPNWNRRQFYTVTRMDGRHRARVIGARPRLAAVQHRPALDAELRGARECRRSTRCRRGEKVFAGQRNDAFFVDLGAIFDLGDLRPFQNLHLIPTAGDAERRHAAHAQRPLDRDPGADRGA